MPVIQTNGSMNSSQLKLQNTEVFVGLVGDHSIAQPGDTSKYFSRISEGEETERIYVDGCTPDAGNLFSVGNLQNYIKHAVEGGTSAVFLSGAGITRMGDYDRKQLMSEVCRGIGKSMAQFDPDISMTYAFVGLTDTKVVDFHRDRMVSLDKLKHGLNDLQHEVDDWEVTEDKILRGATLPFVLSLHFESLRDGAPTNGHLCVVDLSIVNWSLSEALDSGPKSNGTGMLQQSTTSLSKLIHLMANDAILTGVSIPANALITLVGEFLYGESKTAFVVYLNTDEGAGSDLTPTLQLIKSVRKLKSREIIKTVDRRVMFFYEKAKYYQGEKYRLQDEIVDVQDEKEQAEKDLDDIQRDFGEEREALEKEVTHWQEKGKTLENTIASLRSTNQGIEADARWENARLVTEKMAMKDELRRAEIEMAAAEDSKSQLLDLYESLQNSYDSLDSVYSELLAAYRMLKDRYGQLADEDAELQQSVTSLQKQVDLKSEQIDAQKTANTEATAAHATQIELMETRLAQETEALELKLDKEKQRSRQQQAQITQLETANKAMVMSQSEEVVGLQTTIGELSSKLEEVESQAASEAATLSGSLRASEKQVKRLESERVNLQAKVDQLAADNEKQVEQAERQAQWDHERELLKRQIQRLQKTAENSQRRETELREESEQQWAAWEQEKNRNHQKYLRLRTKFRDAVEFAADAQLKFDSERANSDAAPFSINAESALPLPVTKKSADADEEDSSAGTNSKPKSGASKANGQKTQRRKAPARRAKETIAISKVVESAESTKQPTQIRENSGSPQPAPRARRSQHRAPPNYTESGDNSDADFADDFSKNHLPSADVTSDNMVHASAVEDSSDSEISFNPAAIAAAEPAAPDSSAIEPPAAAPKRRRGTLRAKKSTQELNAELRTHPARKRASSSIQDPADDSIEAAEGSPPKRRRGVARPAPSTAAKGRSRGSKPATVISEPANTPAQLVSETAAAETTGLGGAAALKKKRKLNLSRMRNLLGITSDRPSVAFAAGTHAVKFNVPKIRTGSTHATAADDTASADSD
ncbi:hypothetical protein COEREDRAFT_87939 [Coemansia reversa NRRL 1564]|uniref:Kinesin motor domain-containing protein n=1 Tax=Coemansia reversa (strain ATCC 12441 / NRRL 1564) TaxID=763665 RepID=A0A2G5B8L5_COERN|nr:hypothetical protein COEREDRAFT_87939 [Coemansia reversa NRRL 1564]|eukprot:PIA15322.1 hypothetical protein COEREDRAFT_87939 [Coemansia reversa NRRL 1564]